MTSRVVVVTAQPEIRTAVARVVTLAGVDIEVVPAGLGLRAAWRQATAVVVGADLAADVAAADLPRRPAVVLAALAAATEALWRSTVEIGAAHLLVLPGADRQLLDVIAEACEPPPQATVIGVVGGCGGAGASTLAASLALVSSRQASTLLVDGDRLGGGIDALLGVERSAGARWPDLAGTRGRLSTSALLDSVVQVGTCGVLSWGRELSEPAAGAAAGAVIDAAARGCGRIVVDLPRGRDEAADVLLAACDVVAMLVPATVRATLAAGVVARSLQASRAAIQVVVRDPAAGRVASQDVGRALGLPVRATLRTESAVAAAADRGEPPIRGRRGSMIGACRALLDDP